MSPSPPPASAGEPPAVVGGEQAFGGQPAERRDDMLVEVDLSAIIADMEDGDEGGDGGRHGRGDAVATFMDMVREFVPVCLASTALTG